MELDPLDRRILSLLHRDARMSNVAIARQLGVVEGTVRRRVKRLFARRAIRPTVVVAPTLLAGRTIAILGIKVSAARVRDVAGALARRDEVRYLAYATGAYDLIAEAIVDSNEELLRFVTDYVSRRPGVLRVDTSVIPQVVKATYHEALLRESDLAGRAPGG